MTKARSRQKQSRGTSPEARGGRSSAARTPARGAPPSWPAIRWLPSIVGLGLGTFGLFGPGSDEPAFMWSMLVAAGVLVAWNAQLLNAPVARARGLVVSVELRRQHYLQVFVQSAIYFYWGWHMPTSMVRDHVPLLLAQLAFAYGFDLLLSWARRGRYTLGFGPFPIIFSINLFLWFKPEYFFFQFLIVVVGFLAKDLIRWQRDGRRVHIFNPSSFPLALASVLLIATANTGMTNGELIATSQAGPPHMYLMLFLVALPGQFFFGVASMTLAAVVTTYGFGLIYLQATGTYFFLDCYVPVSVFIGMLLLITDPSTAPRSELGRLVFGAVYGLCTIALYQILLSAGVPAFYDKLLQVPLMNLAVRGLDQAADTRLAFINPERLGRRLTPKWRYAAYATIWAATFAIMSATGGVGDRHPGQWWPFWIDACEQGGSARACAYLGQVEQQMCSQGSGWACNEAAILGPRSSWGLHAPMDESRRAAAFAAGCRVGFAPACRNGARLTDDHPTFERAPPTLADYPIILRGSRVLSLPDATPAELYARACAQGWPGTCELAKQPPTP